MAARLRPSLLLTFLSLVLIVWIWKLEPIAIDEIISLDDLWSTGNDQVIEQPSLGVSSTASTSQVSPKETQQEYNEENEILGAREDAGKIYGTTLHQLAKRPKPPQHSKALQKCRTTQAGSEACVYNPYSTRSEGRDAAESINECETPWTHTFGRDPEVVVYPGHLGSFPDPAFGSYDELGIDGELCFERSGRLGQYGYDDESWVDQTQPGTAIDWDAFDWGDLQELCYVQNAHRFTSPRTIASRRNKSHEPHRQPRTAVLLRSYSGKEYLENDVYNMRALITELSLRSGGEYQVFLLIQIKELGVNIWKDERIYAEALREFAPKEFWNMTILWDDSLVQLLYPNLPLHVANVHQAQWLSVQKFALDFPEFEYIWNWELDSRYTGHYYDLLEKLSAFAKRQPRRGMWERSERFYIESVHGGYDTAFRKSIEQRYEHGTIWAAPSVVGVEPSGPSPPVPRPEDDNYEWGVGDEADLISLGPIFNPINTSWVSGVEVFGYGNADETPRRATIITQSRLSRRLLLAMHEESSKGNHVTSEMTAQTVALHHGLKAVHAPHPVFFDRAWSPASLMRYFNPGPRGESGSGPESPFGWGKEGRFHGSTWYYRAVAPMRLYNNWLGWEDSEVGGPEWEARHGRICLPPMLLHPIKDVWETEPGYSTTSDLPYTVS